MTPDSPSSLKTISREFSANFHHLQPRFRPQFSFKNCQVHLSYALSNNERMSDRTLYRITVRLLQLSVDYVEAGYKPHRSIARDTSFLSQLLRGGLLTLFTCVQRKGWRRRTRLASNQCRRQFYPRTIKRFTCDQTQEHAGSFEFGFLSKL